MDTEVIMLALERRNSNRKPTDMPIYKMVGNASISCRVDDLSPTGVRLARRSGDPLREGVCNLELHLVPNKLTTVFTGRLVWRDDEHEAFEFVAPSSSQQAILEKLLGCC
jgi:hypothetical protein